MTEAASGIYELFFSNVGPGNFFVRQPGYYENSERLEYGSGILACLPVPQTTEDDF